MQITCKNAKFIFRFKISAGNLEKITDDLLPKIEHVHLQSGIIVIKLFIY